MPDDHSEVVPLLPIPNRTVKRLCADDSADSRVKVGHRQAIKPETPSLLRGRFFQNYTGGSPIDLKKTQKRFQHEEIHAIIQGFADHSKANEESKNSSVH
jgi:hypothetical protein